MVAIGIDLGTTYSCVGIWQNDRVEIISNDQGNRTTPSYVSFNDKERLIGDSAKNQASMNPINTLYDAKRLIGRKFNDIVIQEDMKTWPFKIIEKDEKPLFEVSYMDETKTFHPEEISSMILIRMKEIAESYLGEEVKDAVVSGAVKVLLITGGFIKKERETEGFEKIDILMKKVEEMKGKIYLISSEHEGGKKLDGLGGIACLLRYKLNY